MRVAVTGATGLIGSALVRALRGRGDEVIVLTRDPDRARETLGGDVEAQPWPDPRSSPPPQAALERTDAVINLQGEPIAQRWTPEAKREIRDSRVLGTRSLVAAIVALAPGHRPSRLISGSAIGYYGARGAETLDETGSAGHDFLGEVTAEWEREASAISAEIRVVLARTGVVLAAGAGALLHCVDDERAAGPINLTAPNPVTNAELSRALGRVIQRPAVLPVPGLALRLLYGEMAATVLTGQRVIPRRLLELGYQFKYADVEAALRAVLSAPPATEA